MKLLRKQLNLKGHEKWQLSVNNILNEGSVITPGEILFQKIEDEAIDKQVNLLSERASAVEMKGSVFPPIKDQIQYDHFSLLDIRAGKILQAEKMKKSKKLLKITVDLGFEKRVILSGIAEHFSAEEVKGKSVCVVANLAPRKMMGIESNGMILMAEESNGKLRFIETDATPGSPVN